jgi:uncharacterized membrane protein
MVKISTRKETPLPASEMPYHERRALDRLIFFSDGVFAIAITLLVLNVALPATHPGSSSSDFVSLLLAALPRLFTYALSFLVIGAYWMAHQRTFHYIEHYDRTLAWLNLIFLLFVALVPFPTGVISEYSSQGAVILYAVTLGIVGVLLSALWAYASHNHRLVAKKLGAEQIHVNTLKLTISPLVFFASIGVSFVSIPAAEIMWVLLFVATRALEWI